MSAIHRIAPTAHPHRKNRHHHPIAPSARYTAIGEKTAEERFNMLARGWLAYPVTPTHHTSTAEERLYKRHPGMRQRRITHRNPIRTTRQRRAHGASAGHHLYALRRCATSPSRRGASPSKKPPSSSHCANGAIHRHRRKTAEKRFNMLARGWLAYPVTSMHSQLPPKSGCRNPIPSVCLPRDALRHTQRAEPPFPGSPALRLNQLLFSYSITFCALPSTTTT